MMTEERIRELLRAEESFLIFDSLSPQECSELASALLATQERVRELEKENQKLRKDISIRAGFSGEAING